MAIKQTITLDETIEFLNQLLEIDRNAIGALVTNRVPCNSLLAHHESVQVGQRNGGFSVGMFGIINGLFGVDEDNWGQIVYDFDHENIIKFRRTLDTDKPKVLE